MTDIKKLVKRLRIGGLVSETQVEAADALEAQVRETAQLAETSLENHAVAQILLVDYRARIAELEELLTEPLYASEHYVLNKTYKKHANDKVGRITVSFGWMRRLHAALNGEKV